MQRSCLLLSSVSQLLVSFLRWIASDPNTSGRRAALTWFHLQTHIRSVYRAEDDPVALAIFHFRSEV